MGRVTGEGFIYLLSPYRWVRRAKRRRAYKPYVILVRYEALSSWFNAGHIAEPFGSPGADISHTRTEHGQEPQRPLAQARSDA